MGGFSGTFRDRMEKPGADLDYGPLDAHQKLGRIEKRNHVWRGVNGKTVDEMQLIGPADMDMGVVAAPSPQWRDLGNPCRGTPRVLIF